jgi:hypothetical protein
MPEWRPIAEFPGYEASSLGQVRSCDRIIVDKNGLKKRLRSKILRPVASGPQRSYLSVPLGRTAHRNIHVLICEAFHGPRPPGHEVAHNDGNSFNNTADNLRWATKQENNADRDRHGTWTRGETHGPCKMTEQQVHETRRLCTLGFTAPKVAAIVGIQPGNVYNIKNGKSWKWLKHKDFPNIG